MYRQECLLRMQLGCKRHSKRGMTNHSMAALHKPHQHCRARLRHLIFCLSAFAQISEERECYACADALIISNTVLEALRVQLALSLRLLGERARHGVRA